MNAEFVHLQPKSQSPNNQSGRCPQEFHCQNVLLLFYFRRI